MSQGRLGITEMFYSIQGESTYVGRPCIFIRLSGCPLNCNYCDTEYSFAKGTLFSYQAILEHIKKWDCSLVEVTGGEPLAQKDVYPFLSLLCDQGKQVLLETGGAFSIQEVDSRVIVILDVKTPSSGEQSSFFRKNLEYLKYDDEVKFVISDRFDFDWACEFVQTNGLKNKVLFSPSYDVLELKHLADWILEASLESVCLNHQFHKVIWPSCVRGV